MSVGINCFTKHGRKDLSDQYKKLVDEGMPEKEAARKVILSEHEKLHNELNSLKKQVNPKAPIEKYIPHDNTEEIKKINDEYSEKINQEGNKSDKQDEQQPKEESKSNEPTIETSQGAGGAEKVQKLKDSVTDKAEKLKTLLKAKLPSGTKSMGASGSSDWVIDQAVKVIHAAIDAGKAISDAVKEGLNHIKESDWYKSLSDKDKIDTNELVKAHLEELANERKIGVHHAALTELAKELGLPEPERADYISPQEYAQRGRKLVEAGAKLEEIDNTSNDLHDRISIGRAYEENLYKELNDIRKAKGENSKEYEAKKNELNELIQKVKKLGSKAGQAMTSLQGERDIDTDNFEVVRRNFEEETGKAPSKEQEKKIKELTDTNEKLKKRADEAEAKLIEETEKAFKAGEEAGKKKSKGEKAKTIADKLRENAKLHKPNSFSAATPASLVWDAAVEIVAKGIEAGGKIADVIEKGLEHIRSTDWYKSLKDDKKEQAEKDFKDFHYDNTDAHSLEDLQARFVDKTGKFTQGEAKSIWDYAKETYLDKGVPFREMIGKVSDDLGLTWKQVSEAITTPKTKPISDEMWKKQSEYRKNQNATKNWVKLQGRNYVLRGLLKLSGMFRGSAVFGHGAIFVGTHSGMTLFDVPKVAKTFKAFLNGYRFAYGNKANYERSMEELKHRGNYLLAQRAGLKNNPDIINAEEYQKSQQYLGKLSGAGERGFNAIKVLRQDLFDWEWNRLKENEKTPEGAHAIAWLVNNATGATNMKIPEVINEITFAGGMEAARWGKWTRNPARAASIALKALTNKKDVTVEERVFAKVWARRVGTQLATMAGMIAVNAAIQSLIDKKNPVNFTNPNKPDFLKFKFGDVTVDPTSGMRGTGSFIYGLGRIPFESKKELHGDEPIKAAGKQGAGYLRGKLSPFYSTAIDFYTKHDFKGNPLFTTDEKPTIGHHKVSWKEYLTQKLPLPMAEAATEMYNSALNNGACKVSLHHAIDGIISGGLSGATGFRVGEYNAGESNHSPFTDEDKKDPTFKYFLDKGLELPNTALSSEEITNEKNKTKKTIADYPKETQEKYTEEHKKQLKHELSDIKKQGYVYVKTYKKSNGDIDYDVSINKPTKGNAAKKNIDSLSKEELTQVLHIAQSKATTETKKKIKF